jgi:hypothetical protein
MFVRLVNLTPHPVVIAPDDGTAPLTITPGGPPARCRVETQGRDAIMVDGYPVPLVETTFGEVYDLPPYEDGGVLYIVSLIVKQAAQKTGRYDVCSPGEPIRDMDGRVVAVRNLAI